MLIVNIMNVLDESSSFLIPRSVFMATTLLVEADETDEEISVARVLQKQ